MIPYATPREARNSGSGKFRANRSSGGEVDGGTKSETAILVPNGRQSHRMDLAVRPWAWIGHGIPSMRPSNGRRAGIRQAGGEPVASERFERLVCAPSQTSSVHVFES